MRSAGSGKRTSSVEVVGISRRGFWLLVDAQELFVPFRQFPWFKQATIAEVLNVRRPSHEHLQWPDLDVDLAVESTLHPDRFPLISRARPKRLRPRMP